MYHQENEGRNGKNKEEIDKRKKPTEEEVKTQPLSSGEGVEENEPEKGPGERKKEKTKKREKSELI